MKVVVCTCTTMNYCIFSNQVQSQHRVHAQCERQHRLRVRYRTGHFGRHAARTVQHVRYRHQRQRDKRQGVRVRTLPDELGSEPGRPLYEQHDVSGQVTAGFDKDIS